MMRLPFRVAALFLCCLACTPEPAARAPVPPELPPAGPPRVAPHIEPVPPCEHVVHIEVRKSERTLRVRCARGAVVQMTAALGRGPSGPKREEGDQRTPEGRYRIQSLPLPSRFHAFIPIDYPSRADADRALAEGLIGSQDHARIVEAHERGVAPPQDTPLGGDIGIHGEGARWAGDSLRFDWTHGCIAVADSDLDFLSSRIQPGVVVDLLP